MAEKERQMNKKVNSLAAKLKTEEEEVCVVTVRMQGVLCPSLMAGVMPNTLITATRWSILPLLCRRESLSACSFVCMCVNLNSTPVVVSYPHNST